MPGDNKDARRKGNMKCLAYIAVGIIAQTLIIVLFVLLVMRIRNPKVRLSSVAVENLGVNFSSSSPSFHIKLTALVTVKNTNFGHFKFSNSTATFLYRGTEVGEGTILQARARARSTKKLNVTVSVDSSKVSRKSLLHSDINSGVLKLSSYAKLSGKIHLFKVVKKKKSAEMNCTMELNTKTKAIQNLACK
ncbi:late embryogenesis abundant protein At1g64065-like [Juglans microcarpa x Juglans regia]|uniref:late embryogenesis abundant protein At1g64065-like n=1 Tax=Juglans microcarpa x Juglans regia TaxID=2249226 RepID=UPI001B7F4A91|nr:late embryogenesis abundant protein At1g64065-like [Juglans microcarpa x Juglans regia]